MAHRVKLMAGLHGTPNVSIWENQELNLAANLKGVGCRYFKIQQPIDDLGEERSIQFLCNAIVSGKVKYDAKVKDAPSTMARYIKRLVGYGATWVTVWLDRGGLPEVAKLAHDNPDLVPYLCGVIDLTTADPDMFHELHGCSRPNHFARQGTASVAFGIRNFICDIPGAKDFRESLNKGLQPDEYVTLFCPGFRVPKEAAGGQKYIGTPQQAKDAMVDFVIAERAFTDVSDPRFAFTGLRNKLK